MTDSDRQTDRQTDEWADTHPFFVLTNVWSFDRLSKLYSLSLRNCTGRRYKFVTPLKLLSLQVYCLLLLLSSPLVKTKQKIHGELEFGDHDIES